MIDFHCHLLPALDDGAVTVDDSIAMARALAAFGYQTVCCTPHCIKGYYDLNAQKVREATLMLQADLDNANIELELRPGMEYMLDECFSEYVDDLLPLGDTKLVLCEAPQQAHPGFVREGLELIIEKGYVPLIAHPERTQYFCEVLFEQDQGEGAREQGEITAPEPLLQDKKKPGFFKKLFSRKSPSPLNLSPAPIKNNFDIQNRCHFQANLGSFTGYYGETVQRQAYQFLKQGVYSALASDLHDGSSASKILTPGKFETNPLLSSLAAWDGTARLPEDRDDSEEESQIGLF